MLLNGYLLNRAIIQQKYKQQQSSFQTLIPINKMNELSIRLLEPRINTFNTSTKFNKCVCCTNKCI